jgi:hypothetical protein
LSEEERLVFDYVAYETLEDAEIAATLDRSEEEIAELRAEACEGASSGAARVQGRSV